MTGLIVDVSNVGIVVCREGATSPSSNVLVSLDVTFGTVGVGITGGISTTVEDMAFEMSGFEDKVMGCKAEDMVL